MITQAFDDDKQKLIVSYSDLHTSIQDFMRQFSTIYSDHIVHLSRAESPLEEAWSNNGLHVIPRLMLPLETGTHRRICLYIEPKEISTACVSYR